MDLETRYSHLCNHLERVRRVSPQGGGCEDCLRNGSGGVELRVCLSCGHLGCCDSSPNQHARRHAEASRHPIMAPWADDQQWGFCFIDNVLLPGDWTEWWKDDGSARPEESAPVSLFPILFVNFIGTLGFSIVLPFLVFLVTDWGGNAFAYGVVGATYSAFQLVGAPVLGRWSDRFGRKRILFLSQLGTFISWLVFLVAFALPSTSLLSVDSILTGRFLITLPLLVLVLARALDGATGGNVSVANAYLADISKEEDRTRNFGRMAVSSNLGFVAGPALAGVLGATAWGPVAPVFAAAAISLAATLAIAFGLPESRRPCVLSRTPEQTTMRKLMGQEQKDCFEMKAAAKLTMSELLRIPSVPTLLAIYFLVMLSFNFFYVSFPVFAIGTLGWSLTEIGIFFAVMGLLMVVVQGPVLGRVSGFVGEKALIVIGGLTLALGFRLFDTTTDAGMYLAVVLMALGNGLMWPSALSVLSKAAGDTFQGAVQGLAGSLGAIASIAGLITGGVLFATIGPTIFWASAGVILLVVCVAGFLPALPVSE